MDPYHRKLGTDTWYYAKRCFLALALTMAKHMVDILDSTMDDILEFLENVDRYGKEIPAVVRAAPHGQAIVGGRVTDHV
jgi:tetratricopeptide repeat protein 30